MMDANKNLMKVFADKWFSDELNENMVYSTICLLWQTLDTDKQNEIIYRLYSHMDDDQKITFLCKDRDEQVDQLQHDYASAIYDNLSNSDVSNLQVMSKEEIIDYFFYL